MTHPSDLTQPPRKRYVIAKAPSAAKDLGIETLFQQLANAPGAAIAPQPGNATNLLTIELTRQQVAQIKRDHPHDLIIEEDVPLDLFRPFPALAAGGPLNTRVVPSQDNELVLRLRVVGEGPSQPLAKVAVYLSGDLWLASGVTDEGGQVTLTLYGETESTLQRLHIKPAAGFWSLTMDRPQLRAGQLNSVAIKPLSHQFPGFPQQEVAGWGKQAMQLPTVPYRGRGVRVAIVDSGLAVDHPDLQGHDGHDFTAEALGWTVDTVGHGSHVAGVVIGRHDGLGIRGLAPEAELLVCKVFPGGRLSDLIAALNYCADRQVDIVNLSLGMEGRSALLEQTIQQITEQGVACIAAAGNAASAIQYPAAFAEVLAVGAIGQFGTFPEDSDHQTQIGPYTSADGRYFTAEFTCFAQPGQQMDVCGPGVAVVSAIPGQSDAYAAWDGTSMACPHVAGLSALILEARPEIRDLPRGRQRVEALFAALRDSADDLGLPEAYQGRGLPNAARALGVAAAPQEAWVRLEHLLSEALSILQQQVKLR